MKIKNKDTVTTVSKGLDRVPPQIRKRQYRGYVVYVEVAGVDEGNAGADSSVLRNPDDIRWIGIFPVPKPL